MVLKQMSLTEWVLKNLDLRKTFDKEEIICFDCGDTGKIECWECDGNGIIDCDEYGEHADSEECEICDGTGVADCHMCNAHVDVKALHHLYLDNHELNKFNELYQIQFNRDALKIKLYN